MAKNERLKEDMYVETPSVEVDCATCRFRMPGKIGYKNRYCEMFPRGADGKPLEILFEKKKCKFKVADTL